MQVVGEGLGFPEGPIAMADGSVILVEIKRGTLTRVTADGRVQVVADLGGGPNGAAIGPDGAVYVCNNGGFEWHERGGLTVAGGASRDYAGGWIERVDLATGKAERLYERCGDFGLKGPNDIVFDTAGGFYFTDHGKTYPNRTRDIGGLYYALPDGSKIVDLAQMISANGVGLAPDESAVYVADSNSGRLWAFALEAPGVLKSPRGAVVGNVTGAQYFDSLAVLASGKVCVATLPSGQITTVDPATGALIQTPTGDPWTTNICFGGADRRDAWITLSGTGKLARTRWTEPGVRLAFEA